MDSQRLAPTSIRQDSSFLFSPTANPSVAVAPPAMNMLRVARRDDQAVSGVSSMHGCRPHRAA